MVARGGDSGPVTRKLRFADSGPRDASMIVPVIKRAIADPSDEAIELPPEFRPISDSLVGDLIILYAFDLPDTSSTSASTTARLSG